jgi:hypothetical protein
MQSNEFFRIKEFEQTRSAGVSPAGVAGRMPALGEVLLEPLNRFIYLFLLEISIRKVFHFSVAAFATCEVAFGLCSQEKQFTQGILSYMTEIL